jgi:hypothetical protein
MTSMLAQGDGVPVIQFFIVLAFGIVSAVIANGRGRSAAAWFFIGFFFSCFGLILLLCLPDLKTQQEREDRLRQENRRLSERIAKDRMVADARHNQVAQRLGAHDQALGLDTEAPAQVADAPPPLTPPRLAADATAGRWFYARDGQRQGPVSSETIRHLRAANGITGESLVWRQGMVDWTPLRDVPELAGDDA